MDDATCRLLAALPPRELQIAQLTGSGTVCTAPKLASHLNIALKTAQNHISNIQSKAEEYFGWRPSWPELVHYFTRYYSVE